MRTGDALGAVRGALIGLFLMVVIFAAAVTVYPWLVWAWGYAAAHPYHFPKGWQW